MKHNLLLLKKCLEEKKSEFNGLGVTTLDVYYAITKVKVSETSISCTTCIWKPVYHVQLAYGNQYTMCNLHMETSISIICNLHMETSIPCATCIWKPVYHVQLAYGKMLFSSHMISPHAFAPNSSIPLLFFCHFFVMYHGR